MNIVTVVQARRGSTRLPDKVFMDILGKPVIARQLERMSRASSIGKMVVATTMETSDDKIEQFCKLNNISCFRGSTTNLLERHIKAAQLFNADVVVKIPCDCPLIDPQVIDSVIEKFIENTTKVDYVSNLHPATWPDGNDVEVIKIAALKDALTKAEKDYELEHTTPYIWENPQVFNIDNVTWSSGKDLSTTHRWTLDYKEDFEFVKAVYEHLYPQNPEFALSDILQLLDDKPEMMEINKMHTGEYWYKNHLDQLKNIDDKWRKG